MALTELYEFGELPGCEAHNRTRRALGPNPSWLPEDYDEIPEATVCATTYEGYKQYGAEGPKRLNRVGVPGGERISFDRKCTIFFSWRGSAFQVRNRTVPWILFCNIVNSVLLYPFVRPHMNRLYFIST